METHGRDGNAFCVAIDKVSVCLSASAVELGVHLLEHFPQFLIANLLCECIDRMVIGKFIVQL